MRRANFVITLIISFWAILSFTSLHSTFAQSGLPTDKAQIVIKGRVFCLDNNGHRLDADQDCQQPSPRYELISTAGQSYQLLSDDLLATIFTESRVRKMELQVTGVLHNQLELTKIQELRDGKVFDIFYYCEVCKITAYGPGPCPCCYAPLEFIEKPANER